MWGWIIAGVFGIPVGCELAILLHVKKIKNTVKQDVESNIPESLFSEEQRDKVRDVVKKEREKNKKDNKGVVFRKVFGLKKKREISFLVEYGKLIQNVAQIANPKSKHAECEISLKDAFRFAHSVLNRVENLCEKLGGNALKNVNIAFAFTTANIAITLKRNKAVLEIAKDVSKIRKIYEWVKRFANVINPFYWAKQLIKAVVISNMTRELLLAVIDISAWEFAKFYAENNEGKT